MNLEGEILREHSRRQAERIATWVGDDRRRFRNLMTFFLHGEPLVTHRAAWAVGICADRNPGLVRPYLRSMLDKMQRPDSHDAVKRNVVRMLQNVEIPSELLGKVATICFDYLSDNDAPVAVKCCSMTVIARLAENEPDLLRELRLLVEQQLPFSTAGFQARARKLKVLLPKNHKEILYG